MRRLSLLTIASCLFLLSAIGWTPAVTGGIGAIQNDIPGTVDPSQKCLFYMHGAWIEKHGPHTPNPRHGAYEYDKIVAELEKNGFIVISEMRRHFTRPPAYARKVTEQVSGLMDRGVPPENITIIGHSKGALMTLLTASMVQSSRVNFVVMAGCGRRGHRFRRGFDMFLKRYAGQLKGRILSLYDASDSSVGSCREAFDRASNLVSREVVFKTGLGHGLFYSPRAGWIDEVVKWAGP